MKNNSASLFITGDLVPLHESIDLLAAGKVEEVFSTVLPEIRSADLAITNLECAVTDGGEPIRKCGPNLKCTPAVMPALVDAGFKLFALANNHSRDFGDAAFLETMENVEKAGGSCVGGGRDMEDSCKPFRSVVNGLKVTVFNSSMHNWCSATMDNPGAAPLRPAYLAAQIANEKANADFILVIIHDGKEHVPFPSARIRDNYRAFIDAGANACIGHHPHISQGYEVYNNGFIAYSLGNFFFPPRVKNSAPPFWYKSYSVKLNISANKIDSFEILPHFYDEETSALKVMEGGQKEEFMERLCKLNQILKDDRLCDKCYTIEARKYMPTYENNMPNPFYYYCVMGTEEHVDVLQYAGRERALGETVTLPMDLSEFLK